MTMRLTLCEMRRIIREEITGQGESHLAPPVQVLRDKLRHVHEDLPTPNEPSWVVVVGNACLDSDPETRGVALEVWKEHMTNGSWMLEEFPPRDRLNGFLAVLQCCRSLAFKAEDYQADCVKAVNTATNVLRGRQEKIDLQSVLYSLEEAGNPAAKAVHDVCMIVQHRGYGYTEDRKMYRAMMNLVHNAMTPEESAKVIGRFYRCPDEKSTQLIW